MRKNEKKTQQNVAFCSIIRSHLKYNIFCAGVSCCRLNNQNSKTLLSHGDFLATKLIFLISKKKKISSFELRLELFRLPIIYSFEQSFPVLVTTIKMNFKYDKERNYKDTIIKSLMNVEN